MIARPRGTPILKRTLRRIAKRIQRVGDRGLAGAVFTEDQRDLLIFFEIELQTRRRAAIVLDHKPVNPRHALPLEEELDKDYEALNQTAEEWEDEEPIERLSDTDRAALEREIADLDAFTQLATSIDHNAKGKALLKALKIAFAKAAELGAAQKAVIFTESRRTQNYAKYLE